MIGDGSIAYSDLFGVADKTQDTTCPLHEYNTELFEPFELCDGITQIKLWSV